MPDPRRSAKLSGMPGSRDMQTRTMSAMSEISSLLAEERAELERLRSEEATLRSQVQAGGAKPARVGGHDRRSAARGGRGPGPRPGRRRCAPGAGRARTRPGPRTGGRPAGRPGWWCRAARSRLLNPTPWRSRRAPTTSSRWRRERPRRSSFQTTRVSPGRSWSSTLCGQLRPGSKGAAGGIGEHPVAAGVAPGRRPGGAAAGRCMRRARVDLISKMPGTAVKPAVVWDWRGGASRLRGR